MVMLPPKSDWMPPTKLPTTERERTVMPRTTPRLRTTLYPGSSRAVVTIASCMSSPSLVDELPRIRPVEPADAHGCYELGGEVSKIHAVPRAGNRLQRLPVRDAAAGTAVDCAQRPVAPDVFGRGRQGHSNRSAVA